MAYQTYPYITTPPDNWVVWRYMSFLKFFDLIQNQRLWFARCDLLTDHREGDLTEWELKQIRKVASREVAQQNIDGFRQIRASCFVNCWTKNKDSMAMWDLYAPSVGSVAIVSSISKLKRAVSRALERIFIASVDYENRNKGPWRRRHVFDQFLRKDRAFAHEKEVRLLISDDACLAPSESEREILERLRNTVHRALVQQSTASERKLWNRMFNAAWKEACLKRAKVGLTIVVDLAELIGEIVLDPRSKYEQSLVQNLLMEHGLANKPVRRSYLSGPSE